MSFIGHAIVPVPSPAAVTSRMPANIPIGYFLR
jgi:hypothetical protein